MMRRLVASTRNAHKLRELRRLLAPAGVRILSLASFPPLPGVREDGDTLADNAVKKAEAVCTALGLPALADDSGLFVPALDGLPGVRSARYAGRGGDPANIRKLLRALAGKSGPARRAFFAAAVAVALPGRMTRVREGRIWGRITRAPRGTRGFGYDPIFQPRGETRVFAEMRPEEKNRISHRARALKKIAVMLRKAPDTQTW